MLREQAERPEWGKDKGNGQGEKGVRIRPGERADDAKDSQHRSGSCAVSSIRISVAWEKQRRRGKVSKREVSGQKMRKPPRGRLAWSRGSGVLSVRLLQYQRIICPSPTSQRDAARHEAQHSRGWNLGRVPTKQARRRVGPCPANKLRAILLVVTASRCLQGKQERAREAESCVSRVFR